MTQVSCTITACLLKSLDMSYIARSAGQRLQPRRKALMNSQMTTSTYNIMPLSSAKPAIA
jgi:hypothetical protein